MALFGSYSKATLVGNLTRDIEIRTTPSGVQVADISIAINDRIKRGNDWVDETSFFDCTAFGKTAELIQRFGSKGRPVLFECTIRQDRWQDKTSGQNRSKVKFIIDSVTFLSDGKGGGSGSGSSSRQQPKSKDQPYQSHGGGGGGYNGGGQDSGNDYDSNYGGGGGGDRSADEFATDSSGFGDGGDVPF